MDLFIYVCLFGFGAYVSLGMFGCVLCLFVHYLSCLNVNGFVGVRLFVFASVCVCFVFVCGYVCFCLFVLFVCLFVCS